MRHDHAPMQGTNRCEDLKVSKGADEATENVVGPDVSDGLPSVFNEEASVAVGSQMVRTMEPTKTLDVIRRSHALP